MNGTIWQSTLRRWSELSVEPKLYVAFVLAVVGSAAAGPFGTFATTPLTERLGWSLLIHGAGWLAGILVVVPVRFALMKRGWRLRTAFIGAMLVIVALLSIPATWTVQRITGTLDGSLLDAASVAVPVLVFVAVVVIGWLGLGVEEEMEAPSQEGEEADAAVANARAAAAPVSVGTAKTPCPLLERVAPEKRGRLIAMIAQDHYVEVVTDRGSDLLLMRLGDAVAQTDPADSMRIHRSAWVTRDAVVATERVGRALKVHLEDGRVLPVSRSLERAFREFMDPAGAVA